ncbi:trichoplein keratin filament-binding protein [Wyeomyia smithii]|uniref:trichoplein keratin filament-binding protein n=1 Tax=Wyeomyia smithii TaxID=174621 RepID=UPI0024682104|nr:trichoplein keratin filament-binding protein [Wyeomyia smithii]XP_055550493.1 trichoplein keratin filament-binding protein [Wyeomyia smithii]XP_055550494.1 trichoplein keratin filament-binding protein [Wyeomyia smithii]XP_055550495.1 trichoplein keratin filament-binding protein [Wyeomyia smithii]XP_055550496.1 trichoplein keratin filament-binding protein [Wyeomyia smithii]
MKSAKLQAALAKRREAEQIKYQKSAAVERYYDQWSRITSRLDSWNSPKFQQQAEEAQRKREEAEKKEAALNERREKLCAALQKEKDDFQREIKEKQRPKSKPISTDLLESVRSRLNDTEEAKRRMDLEASLYTKWRMGYDRDAVLMDSTNSHQAMAKLNWLDRQVELQLQSEKERKDDQEREIRLHEEARRHEEVLLEKERRREQQIKELREHQEFHMKELKCREQEMNELKLYEIRLRSKQEEFTKEIEQLRVYNDRRRDRVVAMHNLRRIKMLLRERSEAVRNDLKHDLQLLQRISIDYPESNDGINYLRKKFQLQYDLEVDQQTTIENMYESEAKHNLSKWEDKWNEEALVRERQLRCLLDDRITDFESKLIDCTQRQRDLITIREEHIKAIEAANQQLKQQMDEKSKDSSAVANSNQIRELLIDNYPPKAAELSRPSTQKSYRSPTFSSIFPFDDINVRDLTLNEKFNRNEEQSGVLSIPRFGRKKVAWC